MRQFFRFSIFAWIGMLLLATQSRAGEKQKSPPLAKDGQFEITELTETRVRRAYTTSNWKESKLKIEFRFNKPKDWANDLSYLFRIIDIEPILDDAGNLLSKDIICGENNPNLSPVRSRTIKDEFCGYGYQSEADGAGVKIFTTFKMFIDAPPRKSTKIVSIKGKIEVLQAGLEYFTEKGIAKKKQSTFVIPDKAEINVQTKLQEEKGNTTYTVTATGKTNRISSWKTISNDKTWLKGGTTAKSEGEVPNGWTTSLIFQGKMPEDAETFFGIYIPVRRQVFDFHLKEIELP